MGHENEIEHIDTVIEELVQTVSLLRCMRQLSVHKH